MLAKNPAEFWNLSQAAAWVVFRSLEIVESFASPKEHGWQSFMKYPSSWPIPENSEDSDLFSKPIPNENRDKLEQRAAIFTQMQQNATTSQRTFQDALIRGRIVASGRLDSAAASRRVRFRVATATVTRLSAAFWIMVPSPPASVRSIPAKLPS
jgi:hypothetical protein